MKKDKDPRLTVAALGALLGGDLGNFATAATPGGIEAQERAGQDRFVLQDTLPLEIIPYRMPGWERDGKEVLERAGVVFGGPVLEGGERVVFQHVALPNGWRKVPTSHSMWSNLLDEKGRKRAAIFFKAAFYDYNAHMTVLCRYSSGIDYDHEDLRNEAVGVARDGDFAIYRTPAVALPPRGDLARYEVSDERRKVAEQWLDDNFPNWRDPGAYWD